MLKISPFFGHKVTFLLILEKLYFSFESATLYNLSISNLFFVRHGTCQRKLLPPGRHGGGNVGNNPGFKCLNLGENDE